MSLILPKRRLSRRQLLQWSGLAGGSVLLSSCTPKFAGEVGQRFEPLNQSLEMLMQSQHPVPEFSITQVEPSQLLVNSFNGTPEINPAQYRLTIDGEVNQPLKLSMSEIQKLPMTTMVIRHVCVEGWAAIVQWGGVRLQDLVMLAQPKPGVRYIYFKSADAYYETWDIASALHPQTLMAYQKNGQPLPAENGAPLRLASPIKLGYKQSKWVTRIALLTQLPEQKGYWEDEGYEWFAGL